MRKRFLSPLMAVLMAVAISASAMNASAQEEKQGFAAASLPVNTSNNVTSFVANNVATADGATTANLVAVWSGNGNNAATITYTGNSGEVTFGNWVVNPSTTGTVSVTIEQICEVEQTVVFTLTYHNGSRTATVTVPAIDHDFSSDLSVLIEFQAATCVDEGYEVWQCSRCKEKDTKVLDIDADNHVGDTYTDVITEAACEEEGEMGTYCKDCDALISSEDIPALGHDYVGEVTLPTCTEDGYTTYTCTVCGDEYVDDDVDALGHVWGEFDHTDPRVPFPYSACDPFVICKVCGCKEYVYTWTTTDVVPTCTADGYTLYVNSAGWEGAIYDEGSALGHVWGEFDHTQSRMPFPASACCDPVATCQVCGWAGYVYTWEITKVAPTCTDDGYTEYVNSAGWASTIDDEDSAFGHNMEVQEHPEWPGYYWQVCTHCGWSTDLDQEPAIELVDATASASVQKDKGNTNTLTIILVEEYSDGGKTTITKDFTINNNAAGTYTVGDYKVYVDTKGNTQIRACYIVE